MALESSSNIDGEKPPPLRIGIVGVGLVGAVAAIALSRLPNVQVCAFERSPGPRIAGAWISLQVSGLRILDELIDLDEIHKILERGGNNGTYMIRHWRTGEVIATSPSSESTAGRHVQGRTHRAPLLEILVSNVPKGVIQYGRNVTSHGVIESGVQLTFEDGSVEDFDLLIAADGLYSKIRRTYLPEMPQYRGTVAYRKVFPESQVAHIALHNDSSSWRKDGGVAFLSKLGLGQYGIVAIIKEPVEHAASLHWEKNTGIEGFERLRRYFENWDPLINQVLDTLQEIDAYPLESAPWMKQLTRHDRIAFIGDSAHPTAGAYGAGATMGWGDCWALYRSLEESQLTSIPEPGNLDSSHTTYDLKRALRLYNSTRRPLLERVETQISLDGLDAKYIAEVGQDEREWIRRFQERNKNNWWLMEHDVEAEFLKTLKAQGPQLPESEGFSATSSQL